MSQIFHVRLTLSYQIGRFRFHNLTASSFEIKEIFRKIGFVAENIRLMRISSKKLGRSPFKTIDTAKIRRYLD